MNKLNDQNTRTRKELDMNNNARRSVKYEGRRYLGRNKSGKQIWITMRLERASMFISLDCNGRITDLLEDSSELATSRIVQRLGNRKPDVYDMMHRNRETKGGEVTRNTINYMRKLMSAVELKDSISHANGKCTSVLFRLVSNAVFEGDSHKDQGYSWNDVIKNWEFPEGTPIGVNLEGNKIYKTSNYFDVNTFPLSH